MRIDVHDLRVLRDHLLCDFVHRGGALVHLVVLEARRPDPVDGAATVLRARRLEDGEHRLDALRVGGLPRVVGGRRGVVVRADDEHDDLGLQAGHLLRGLVGPVEEAGVRQPARHARVEVGLHDARRAGDRAQRRAQRAGEGVAAHPESQRVGAAQRAALAAGRGGGADRGTGGAPGGDPDAACGLLRVVAAEAHDAGGDHRRAREQEQHEDPDHHVPGSAALVLTFLATLAPAAGGCVGHECSRGRVRGKPRW